VPNTPISGLTDGDPAQTTDRIPVQRGAANFKVSASSIADLAAGGAAHATSHQNGGADEVNVAGLSGLLADQQTPLTHDILTKHNGFPGGTSNFLRSDGTWNAPASAPAPDEEAQYLALSAVFWRA